MTHHALKEAAEAATNELRVVVGSLSDQGGTYRIQESDDLPLWSLRALLADLDRVTKERDEAVGAFHRTLKVTRADEGRFQVGDVVEVTENYRYGEWQGLPLYVVGVNAVVGSTSGDVNYDVSEVWPPKAHGDVTTDFSGADLVPVHSAKARALLSRIGAAR